MVLFERGLYPFAVWTVTFGEDTNFIFMNNFADVFYIRRCHFNQSKMLNERENQDC